MSGFFARTWQGVWDKIEERRLELQEQDERRRLREGRRRELKEQDAQRRFSTECSWTAEDYAAYAAIHPCKARMFGGYQVLREHRGQGIVEDERWEPMPQDEGTGRRGPSSSHRISDAAKREDKARRRQQRKKEENKKREREEEAKDRNNKAKAARLGERKKRRQQELRVVHAVLAQRMLQIWKQWYERQKQLSVRWCEVYVTVLKNASLKRKQAITLVVKAAQVCARVRAREQKIRCSRGTGRLAANTDSETSEDAAAAPGDHRAMEGTKPAASLRNLRAREGAKPGVILSVFVLVLCAGGGRWAVRTNMKQSRDNYMNNSSSNIGRRGRRFDWGQQVMVKTFGKESTRQRIGREHRIVAIEECGERDPG